MFAYLLCMVDLIWFCLNKLVAYQATNSTYLPYNYFWL